MFIVQVVEGDTKDSGSLDCVMDTEQLAPMQNGGTGSLTGVERTVRRREDVPGEARACICRRELRPGPAAGKQGGGR